MKWKRWPILIVLALWVALFAATPAAWAQAYRFSLDRNISHVIVNRDGSADIEYWLTYTCDSGAHVIDIVDVGMPNQTYDLSTAQAWYSAGTGGGKESPVTKIAKNTQMDVGIEVHLNQYSIQPGKQGTLHLKIRVKEMVYPDSKDETYASVEFAPLFYQSSVVHGKTDMEIHLYFPAGVTNEETRYHDKEPDDVDRINDRIVFIYSYPNAKGTDSPKHGISFPRTYVDQVYKTPIVVGGTKSGGTTFSFSSLWNGLAPFACFAFFLLFFIGPTVLGVTQGKKRKLAYLPPSMSVEGVGIKRGLTAVEAGLLLEKPLNKVLTMILFGLLKKKAITVLDDEPLKLQVSEGAPAEGLRDYEKDFLGSVKADGTLDESKLQQAMIGLVKSLNQKMKGFSRKESVTWVPHVRSASTGPSTISSSPAPSVGGGGSRQVTLPTLPGAAFAGTIVSGMERTAGGIVNKLESFTGGVTNKTNPAPKTTSGSSGRSFRSGGGSCACACACAGCACACAGGGR
jgi:hypothetical protein